MSKNSNELKKSNEDEEVMYIIVNQDIKMGKGKISGQCCHGACIVTRLLERYQNIPTYYEDWLNKGEAKVVLKMSGPEMGKLSKKYFPTMVNQYLKLECLEKEEIAQLPLIKKNLPLNNDENYWCVPIRDAGRTQIASNSFTVLAFRPIVRNLAPPIFKTLKLL